jgi:hypothetical protein
MSGVGGNATHNHAREEDERDRAMGDDHAYWTFVESLEVPGATGVLGASDHEHGASGNPPRTGPPRLSGGILHDPSASRGTLVAFWGNEDQRTKVLGMTANQKT